MGVTKTPEEATMTKHFYGGVQKIGDRRWQAYVAESYSPTTEVVGTFRTQRAAIEAARDAGRKAHQDHVEAERRAAEEREPVKTGTCFYCGRTIWDDDPECRCGAGDPEAEFDAYADERRPEA